MGKIRAIVRERLPWFKGERKRMGKCHFGSVHRVYLFIYCRFRFRFRKLAVVSFKCLRKSISFT